MKVIYSIYGIIFSPFYVYNKRLNTFLFMLYFISIGIVPFTFTTAIILLPFCYIFVTINTNGVGQSSLQNIHLLLNE